MSRINLIVKQAVLTDARELTLPGPLKQPLTFRKVFDFSERFAAFAKANAATIKAADMRLAFFKSLTSDEQILDRSFNLEVAKPDDVAPLVAHLRGLPQAEDVREDVLNTLSYVPNDPLIGSLWGLAKVSAQTAWGISRGAGVVVAVCDTGIDPTHPDIAANLWQDTNSAFGYDFSDNDNNASDYHGHGTHVAGTIAASGNNSVGVAGVAFEAKVMSVKIFPNAYFSVAANAIYWAAFKGARVINCSWGPNTTAPVAPDPMLKAAIDAAYAMGCYCVFAAGNSAIDCSSQFPANYSKVITVGATDTADQRSSFSNWGNVVDIAAPGSGILSLQMGTGGYVGFSGTSMAAPHVSGAAALLLSLSSGLSFDNLRYFLRKSGDPINTDRPTSGVRLNCQRLVTPAVQTYKRQTNVDADTARFALQANGQIAKITWTGSTWVQSTVSVWGPSIVPGSLISMGAGRLAGVSAAGHVVNTYGTNSYGPIPQTFGIVPGTLRFSATRSAIFALNVFDDFVFLNWVGNKWVMDIIPCFGGPLIASSVELCTQASHVSAITASGCLAHTWNDPNGVTLSDGSKCGYGVLTGTSTLLA
jgi:thermitase